jgi:quercetin dioxygenase-like cupin family protein
MKLRRGAEVKKEKVEEGAVKTSVRRLIAEPEGAPNFALRLFELEPGGATPLHHHSWEHEVFILEGEAEIASPEGPVKAKAGDAILVEPEEAHQFRNRDDEKALRFLCIIPLPPKS